MSNEFITVKFEENNRKFEYNQNTMELTIVDTYYINKEDVSGIINNIVNLNKEI